MIALFTSILCRPKFWADIALSRNPNSEQDVARYVELEASDEIVQHVGMSPEYIVGPVSEFGCNYRQRSMVGYNQYHQFVFTEAFSQS